MITINKIINVLGDSAEMELKGLSSDDKPDEIGGFHTAVNSMFLEQDTGDFYYLDSTATQSETTLMEEQTFTATSEIGDHIYDMFYGELLIQGDVIVVVYDGTTYECENRGTESNLYGAPWVEELNNYDFSTYPFCIECIDGETDIYVGDNNEHTIEIYTESVVPAVWKKIPTGSGGGSEMNLMPKLTVTFVNDTGVDIYIEDGEGYTIQIKDNMPYARLFNELKAGETKEFEYYCLMWQNYNTPFELTNETAYVPSFYAYEKGGEGEYGIISYSNLVNCEYDEDEGDYIVLDHSKPVSCTITFNGDN